MTTELGTQFSKLSRQERALLFERLREKKKREAGSGRIERRDPALERLPLSFSQQRLWLLDRLEPGNPAYNLHSALLLGGGLDPEILRRALEGAVARHEALRTVFQERNGHAEQVVLAEVPVPLPVVDLAGMGDASRELIERLAAEESRRPFDLAAGPLLRTTLLRVGEERHVLLFVLHHIVSDAWSIGVLMRETVALYGQLSTGVPAGLPELPIQYPDFAIWQREWLNGERLERHLAFWRGSLEGLNEALPLPADRPRPPRRTFAGAQQPLGLDEGVTAGLRELARGSGATLFIVLLAALKTLLHRYSGEDDLSVGSPVANRDRAETADLIGFFVNTLVLRGDLSGDQSFLHLVERLRAVALAAYEHQSLPFERIVEELRPERDPSRSPLVQVMFSLQNTPEVTVGSGGLPYERIDYDSGTAQFELSLSLEEEPGRGLSGFFEYSIDLFEAATMARMAGHLRTLIAGILADPGQRLSDLPLLSGAEVHQTLLDWAGTREVLPRGFCLHELVMAQAERTPDAVAVEWEGGNCTYRELASRAGLLARHLRGLGVGPERIVGLCVERSLDMVVGLLGTFQAGGAYLPLDPSYPRERLAGMVEHAGVSILLVHESTLDVLPEGMGRLVRLDGDWEALDAAGAAATPENLACLLYTSGSTGRPKGVMVPHAGLVNRLLWAQEVYSLGPADAVLQKAPLAFDFSVWECFAPLIAGARLVLARPGGHRDSAYLSRTIAERGVTLVHFVPSMLRVWLEEPGIEGLSSLRQVFSGGEALAPELRDRFAARLAVPLDNQYGPTETSIDTTRWTCESDSPRVPIGRPIANTRVHLVDQALRPVPIGVPGELLVGGAGVVRGYFGRPDLTSERFVPDPFAGAGAPGARLYRTGDLARWLPDGTLEFLGRIDHQVKIRGVRIELGEIEAVLAKHPGVRAAAVVIPAEGEPRLTAWIVPGESSVPSPEALREFAREYLPEAMTPSAFLTIDGLPLTGTSKVDRRELARRAAQASPVRSSSAAPRTPVEELVAGLWAEILDPDRKGLRIGSTDNFFHLGGHSLLATQVISRVRAALGVEVPVRTLFEAPALDRFSAAIEAVRLGENAAPPIRRAPRGRRIPLSFAQQRLWFLDQLEPGTAFYNVPQALRLHGPLRPAVLEAALAEVTRRHESLRTTFRDAGGSPYQVVVPEVDVRLPLVDLSGLEEEARERERARLALEDAQRPFDLKAGPLLRGTLLRLAPGEHAALLNVHHIVSDGWSSGVLTAEMGNLYDAFSSGRPSPLPELPIQYPDYAVWQREWLRGGALEAQLSYWRRSLAGVPGLALPTDRPRPAVETFRGTNRLVELPPELSEGLRALARREGTTLFMTLLAAFATVLYRSSGQTDLPVGSPIANRNRSEVEGLIGFFSNTLVLRCDLGGEPTFRELLGRIREVALGGYAHQEIPFEKLVEELQPERDMSRNPLFQVMMVLQNQPRPTIRLTELTMTGDSVDPGIAKFDLTLFWWEAGDQIGGLLEHNTDLFDNATALRLFHHLEALLAGVTADSGLPLLSYPLLDDPARHQILTEWNETADSAEPLCVHNWVEIQAQETPDAVAAMFEGRRLTYRELNQSANRLAHGLRRRGVGPEVLVGICVERSLEMVTAMLAVLKAGGAAVALDPAYPVDRLAYIIREARLPVLLTQTPLLERFPEHAAIALCLDGEELFPRESAANPESGVTLDHPMYAIYTSGSTGLPKGILVTHRAFANLLDWQFRRSGLGLRARTVQFATFGFCVSFQEIFSSWCSGSTLVIASEMTRRDVLGLNDFLEAEQVERLHLPFAALKHLAEAAGAESRAPGRLREVITAGEQLQVNPAVRAFFDRLPGCVLHNQYGASETHVVSALALTGSPAEWPAIPAVGRPISNVRVHLLDSELRPVPVGVPGELYAAGACLPRGYLNDPVLTAQKLVPDPFGEPGARLYRTGDQARYLADGRIEYHGRIDTQVKIRGFRVELGEIETTLARHPAVRDAAVVAVRPGGSGETRLVAYVVPQEPMAPDAPEEALFDELGADLKRGLPEYMVPAAFVRLDRLPVNANGKLDQAALPAPDAARLGRRAEFLAPRTPVEQILAGFWGEVLGIERIGARDNFFALGGHSLLATQLVARVRGAFKVELPLRRLFEAPTVGEMAAAVLALEKAPGQSEKIARVLVRLQSLSPESKQALRGRAGAEGSG